MPLDLFQRDATEALDSASRSLAPALPQTFSETFEPAWQYGVLFGQSTARGRARAEAMMDYIDNVHGRTGVMLPNPEFAALGQDGLGEFNAAQEKLNTQFPGLELKPLDDAAIDELAAKKAARARVDYATMQAREKTWGGALGAVTGSLAAGITDPINLLAFPLAAPASLGVLGTAAAWAGIAGGTQAAIELAGLEFREKAAPGYQASGEPFANIAGAAAFGGALGGGLKGASALWQRLKVNPDLPRTIRDAGNVVESESQVANTNPFKPLALPHPDQFRPPIDVNPEGVAWQRGTFPHTMDAAQLDAVHRAALAKAVDDVQAGRPVDVDEIMTPEALAAREAAVEPVMAARQRQIDAAEAARVEIPVVEGQQELPLARAGAMAQADNAADDLAGGVQAIARNAGYEMPAEEAAAVAKRVLASRTDGEARGILDAVSDRPSAIADTLPTATKSAKNITENIPGEARRAQDAALVTEVTPTRTAKLRADPATDDAVLNDFDKLRATKDAQVPVEQVDASGQRVAVMQSADKIMEEADARLAAAKEIAACATPQPEQSA